MSITAEEQPRLSRLQRVMRGEFSKLPESGYKVVSIDRLVPNPKNERKTFRNMDWLVKSIQSVGILEPLIVEPLEAERYLIVIGERRYRAAKQVGLDRVPIIIGDSEKEALRRRKSIISNVQREDVGPIELAEGLRALLEEDQAITNQQELAEVIGKDKTWVSGMLRILTLPQDLQEKVGTSQLSVPYDAMIRIARIEDRTEQERLIDALLGGASNRQIREEISTLKGVPPKSTEATSRKPKTVYTTDQNATVIVQSLTETLTPEQTIEALKQALRKAKSNG